MTEKLYYLDSHMSEFSARVLSCVPQGDEFIVLLDKTAFFPEGGGQAPDCGYIAEARVLDVQEKVKESFGVTLEAEVIFIGDF